MIVRLHPLSGILPDMISSGSMPGNLVSQELP